MAFRYGNTLKTIYFVCFYAYIIPHTVVVGLLAIFIQYWINKYLLLRRHCRPPRLGGELSHSMANMLELITVFMFAGAYAFESDLYNGQVSGWTWYCLMISLFIYIFLSKSSYFETNQINMGENNYDSYKYKFQTNYDRENPVTREEATETHLQHFY